MMTVRSLQQYSSGAHSGPQEGMVESSPAAYQEFVFTGTAAAVAAQQPLPSWTQHLHALLKFSRPHTMLGTFVSVTSISLLSLVSVLGSALLAVTTKLF